MSFPDEWAPILPCQAIALPEDFLWGVASATFQAEGGEVPCRRLPL
jgi:hypothetical protein